MINAYNFHNPVEAHDAMCEQLIWGDNTKRTDYDWSHGTEVGQHNVSIFCESVVRAGGSPSSARGWCRARVWDVGSGAGGDPVC